MQSEINVINECIYTFLVFLAADYKERDSAAWRELLVPSHLAATFFLYFRALRKHYGLLRNNHRQTSGVHSGFNRFAGSLVYKVRDINAKKKCMQRYRDGSFISDC